LNVALTRSKNGLFVVGNIETIRKGGSWMGNGSTSHKFDPDWIRRRDFGDVDVELVSGSERSVWRDYVRWLEDNKLVRDWKNQRRVDEVDIFDGNGNVGLRDEKRRSEPEFLEPFIEY